MHFATQENIDIEENKNMNYFFFLFIKIIIFLTILFTTKVFQL